jgi:hypothetical protein
MGTIGIINYIDFEYIHWVDIFYCGWKDLSVSKLGVLFLQVITNFLIALM